MKSAIRALTLSVLLLLLASAAYAGNDCPKITSPSDKSVDEEQTVTFTVKASDPNDDDLTLTASGLPLGAGFVENNNDTGTFTWTPSSTQSGTYAVTFTVDDNHGCTRTDTTVITVNDVNGNDCPTITSASTKSVNEGQALTFTVTASDPDGDDLTLTASDLPSGATFYDNSNNTGTFTWTPSSTQSGTYAVTFTVDDNHGCTRTATTVITVNDVSGNDCPTITSASTMSVNEGQALTFTVTASDPNGDDLTLTASGLPSGAGFIDNNNNTGTFTWTPTSTQSGTYTVTFTVNDNQGCTQTDTTVITVVNVTSGNDCPTITSASTKSVNEGQTLTFTVTASDPNGDDLTLTASGLPSGSGFVDNNNNTGTFTWTPTSTQSGTYTVTFTVNDNQGCTRTDTTVITVINKTGDGTVEGTGIFLGRFKLYKPFLCFRITPLDDSFDLRDVILDSIVLTFDGNSVRALPERTHIAPESHLRACFSMSDLQEFFGEPNFRDKLMSATIRGQLTTGQTFIVTLYPNKYALIQSLGSRVSPNPLNPKADLTFSLSQPGHVRVGVYDVQGRLVKSILDENRPAGAHTLTWDGTDTQGGKVSSGVYFFRVQAVEGQDVVRITVLK